MNNPQPDLARQFRDMQCSETWDQMWERAVDPRPKPFVPEQYPGYEKLWPELARK